MQNSGPKTPAGIFTVRHKIEIKNLKEQITNKFIPSLGWVISFIGIFGSFENKNFIKKVSVFLNVEIK